MSNRLLILRRICFPSVGRKSCEENMSRRGSWRWPLKMSRADTELAGGGERRAEGGSQGEDKWQTSVLLCHGLTKPMRSQTSTLCGHNTAPHDEFPPAFVLQLVKNTFSMCASHLMHGKTEIHPSTMQINDPILVPGIKVKENQAHWKLKVWFIQNILQLNPSLMSIQSKDSWLLC